MEIEQPAKNSVEVSLKKSSSKDGNVGYDLTVRTDGTATEEMLNDMATKALKVALRVQEVLIQRGV